MATRPELSSPYTRAILAIDAAHSEDPNPHPSLLTAGSTTLPYELHYAQRMTHYLHLLDPSPSPTLSIAIRAQHFRRWETPRATYPAGRLGYLKWRTDQKTRAASAVRQICVEAGTSEEEAERVAALIRKENLKGDEETQMLEDAACLVFLDEQFEGFERQWEGGEGKMIELLRKTWGKMGVSGREEALKLDVGEKGKALLAKALATGDVGERGDKKLQ